MGVDEPSETELTEIRFSSEDRRGPVDHYTTVMLQQLIWLPYSSIPEIMKTLSRAGPFEEKRDIMEVSGSRAALKKRLSE